MEKLIVPKKIRPARWLVSAGVIFAIYYLSRPHGFASLLPAAGDAVQRAGAGLVGVALVLIAAQALGAVFFRWMLWEPDHWSERVLFRAVLGLGGIGYLSLILAALEVYRPQLLSALVGVMAAGGLLYWGHVWFRSPGDPARAGQVTPVITDLVHIFSGKGIRKRLWILASAVAAAVALIGALAPESGQAALWYHLWLPMQWLEHGRPVDVMRMYAPPDPLHWEMIYGAAMAVGGVTAAKLLHYSAYLLLGWCVYRTAARFIPGASPWLAAALYFTAPTVLWAGSTATVDLGFGLHIGAMIYALLHYLERRDRRWLVLAMITLGLALSIRHLALIVLAAVTGSFGMALWLRYRDWKRAVFTPAALAGAALVFPLPWYVSAWVAAGTPFLTELLPANMLLLPGYSTGMPGIQALLLLAVLAFYRRLPHLVGWMLAFAVLYTATWTLPLSWMHVRFLIPLAPVLAVLGSAVFSHIAQRSSLAVSRALVVGLLVVMVFNVWPVTALPVGLGGTADKGLTEARMPLGVVMGGESEQTYLEREVRFYAAWQYASQNLPAASRVLIINAEGPSQVRRTWFGSRGVTTPSTGWGASQSTEKQALAQMQRAGITHVLIERQVTQVQIVEELAFSWPEFVDRYCQEIYQDGLYRLYQLKGVDILLAGG